MGARKRGREEDRKTGRQEDRKTGRQEDRKTGRQEDRKTGRQEDRTSGRQDVRMSGCQVVRASGRQGVRASGRRETIVRRRNGTLCNLLVTHCWRESVRWAMQNPRNLQVWPKARELVVATYRATAKFPRSEIFGASLQMRRAAPG